MKNIVTVISAAGGPAHYQLTAEALRATAAQMGCRLTLEADGILLKPQQIASADVVLLAEDTPIERSRFAGKPVYGARTSEAIRHTRKVISSALELVRGQVKDASPAPGISAVSKDIETTMTILKETKGNTEAPAGQQRHRLVAITACPTGIAHTFMAAEALMKSARALGHDIKVETQGSVGSKNQLTAEDIAQADAVIIAAETNVDLARFAGKRLYSTSTKEAMRAGKQVIGDALALPLPSAEHGASSSTGGSGVSLAQSVEQAKAARASQRSGAYKHLMTGVSYMLPLVTAGGLAIAMAFAVGGIYAGKETGTLAAALNQIGGGTAFQLFVAVFAGFISFSIADRPGIAPGLVGGMLAQNMGAGFLGGIIAGFMAGYFTKFVADNLRLPPTLEGLKPVLILPFLCTIVIGLLMIYVVAPPVQHVMVTLTEWLNSMRGANALLLGILLGGMMAFDMGGPVNKAAYTFGVGLVASQVYGPMAAIMAAGMTPPLGVALASKIFRDRFDDEEREAGNAAFVLGLAFITEGAIPFAAKDPLRVIPALMLGSATAGAIAMFFGSQFLVPHGGMFAALIPGAVNGLGVFVAAVAIGTLVTALAVCILKSKVS